MRMTTTVVQCPWNPHAPEAEELGCHCHLRPLEGAPGNLLIVAEAQQMADARRQVVLAMNYLDLDRTLSRHRQVR